MTDLPDGERANVDDERRRRRDEDDGSRRWDDDERERRRGHDAKPPLWSKGYCTSAQEADTAVVDTDPVAAKGVDDEDFPYASDSSHSTTYRVELIGSFSSFLRSHTMSVAGDLPNVDLPTPPTIGRGLSYLNGHLLPIEVWLSHPSNTIPTVMGCGDTGGQCLIRRDTWIAHVPDVHIRDSPGLTVLGLAGSAAGCSSP